MQTPGTCQPNQLEFIKTKTAKYLPFALRAQVINSVKRYDRRIDLLVDRDCIRLDGHCDCKIPNVDCKYVKEN